MADPEPSSKKTVSRARSSDAGGIDTDQHWQQDPDATIDADFAPAPDPDATIDENLLGPQHSPTVLQDVPAVDAAAATLPMEDGSSGHRPRASSRPTPGSGSSSSRRGSGSRLLKDADGIKEVDAYQIIDFLGEGGMGTVFRAQHRDLGRITALKVVHLSQTTERNAEQFLREARLAATVEHPNLVTLYDFGQVDDLLYMAMRFVDGGDVDQKLKREGVLPAREAIGIMLDCTRAVDAIFNAEMVHRDIKPGNIFLDRGGNAYLGDLGLACLVTDKAHQQGGFAGTPAFASPEQAQLQEVDIRSDVYSLGGVFYAMLTASRPFEGSTPFEVLGKVISAPTPDPRVLNPDCPDDVAAVIMRAMAKDRDLRYATPNEMLEDLMALAGDKALVHTRGGPVGTQPRPSTERYNSAAERQAVDQAEQARRVTVLRQSGLGYQVDDLTTDDKPAGLLKRLARRLGFGRPGG